MRKVLLILVIIFVSGISYGLTQKKIVIKGNEYIDDEAIYSIIGGDFNLVSDTDKNKIIKLLYNTGNFKNITIEEKEESFVISIEESSVDPLSTKIISICLHSIWKRLFP